MQGSQEAVVLIYLGVNVLQSPILIIQAPHICAEVALDKLDGIAFP